MAALERAGIAVMKRPADVVPLLKETPVRLKDVLRPEHVLVPLRAAR